MQTRKYLIIDHNVLITSKTIQRGDRNTTPSVFDLFNLLSSDFIFFTLKEKYQEDFQEVIPYKKTNFIEDCKEDIENWILFLAQLLSEKGKDLYSIFQNDNDRDNDFKLLGFALYTKEEKKTPFVFLHRENKIRKVCEIIGLNDCCVLHILNCFIENGFTDFENLKKSFENSKIPHPKWVSEMHCENCNLFF